MFIGDGMGSPQVTATQYYLGALENPDAARAHPRTAGLHHLEERRPDDHLRRYFL